MNNATDVSAVQTVYEEVEDAITRKLHLAYRRSLGRNWHSSDMGWHYPDSIRLGNIVMRDSDCGSVRPTWEITTDEWSERVEKYGLWKMVGIWEFVPADDPAADCVRSAFANPAGAGADVYRLRKENAILEKGIVALRELIDESRGVVGLHLNGEDASWESLQRGGMFEDWLIMFNAAEDVISS